MLCKLIFLYVWVLPADGMIDEQVGMMEKNLNKTTTSLDEEMIEADDFKIQVKRCRSSETDRRNASNTPFVFRQT